MCVFISRAREELSSLALPEDCMTVSNSTTAIRPTILAMPSWTSRLARLTLAGSLATGMWFAGSGARAQSTVPDAQVESNVLKALATAPELATESITTRTMYGTVTLSGSVRDENTRRRAENLAANANGVKKVVDELRLDSDGQTAPAGQTGSQSGMVLQSDGTYAPAASTVQSDAPSPGSAPASISQRNDPDADYQLDQQRAQQQGNQTGGAQASVPSQSMPRQPYPGTQDRDAQNSYPGPQPPYPGMRPNRRPLNPYPQQPGYPPYGQPEYARNGQQPMYNGGQAPGQPVVVPSGELLRIRLNRTLSSNRTPAGTIFDGVITNDVVANGVVAIPRGASVQGTVVDAKSSGVLKGRGEISIQLTQVTLAGRQYPIVSDLWAHHGGDKTIESINKTAGFGAGGALLGALAGGGKGAAIGAGVGAAVGLGSAAASGNGQVFLPAETLVTFHLAEPANLQTVSEQEMQRLAYGVPEGAENPQQRFRRYPRVVVGPTYYPGYYPYPYGAYGPGVTVGVPVY